jgi:DNA-directed RNA polymerase specialized sigma24 family protein
MARQFEEVVLPHLDAAFNYARWLTKNDADAQDVVQDACVRALRFFSSLRDDDARAWLMTIVRNTWYSRFSGHRGSEPSVAFDVGVPSTFSRNTPLCTVGPLEHFD